MNVGLPSFFVVVLSDLHLASLTQMIVLLIQLAHQRATERRAFETVLRTQEYCQKCTMLVEKQLG